MSSFRQIEANRRNAQFSTGPVTEEGKRRSCQNAVRHGLTAETVICAIEDADDYEAFQLAIASDFDAQSVVERELVLRLASLLWRLRRATAIETGLFNIQACQLLHSPRNATAHQKRQRAIDDVLRGGVARGQITRKLNPSTFKSWKDQRWQMNEATDFIISPAPFSAWIIYILPYLTG